MRKSKLFQIIALLLCSVFLLSACAEGGSGADSEKTESNTYKTPVTIMEDIENSKKFTGAYDAYAKMLNGFGEQEIETILKLFKKSDTYQEQAEYLEEAFEDRIEDMKDEYGSNYKVSYKITRKEPLEKEDLKDVRERLRSIADQYETMLEDCTEYDDDDWSYEADRMGLSVSDAKAVFDALGELGKLTRKATVTDGYALRVTRSVTGSELDDPEENEATIRVYKINDRWVAESAISFLGSIGGL